MVIKCKFETSIKFSHKKNSSLTITAVRPPARFGELIFNRQKIKSFEEKIILTLVG